MLVRSLLILLLGLSFTVLSPVHAFVDTYVVRNIQVHATADSAVAAQEQALADGRMKAFQILISRLQGYDGTPDFEGLTPEKLEDLVLDYEVKKQKNSAIRYVATLDFRFDEAAVKKFMQQTNVKVQGGRKDSLVVIPVLETATQRKLWERDNPWFTSWLRENHFRTAHPIIIPMGDLTDISEVSPEQAVSQDINALHQLARRYGAGGALLAIAHQQKNGNITIAITLTTLDGTLQSQTISLKESTPWSQAVAQTISALKALDHTGQSGSSRAMVGEGQTTTEASPVKDTQQQPLSITIPLANLNTWMHVQRVLQDVAPVNKVQLKSMSSKTANIQMKYSGSLPALESALGARGLQLSQGADNRWILSTGTNPNTSAW
ncbi:MAG: DUF2066 domain-containing protein [Pseudomonadota bacterium]